MPRTLDRRIEGIDIDDGRKIVLLRAGWAYQDANTEMACHTFGADTNAEIRRTMKEVEQCRCPDCAAALEHGTSIWNC